MRTDELLEKINELDKHWYHRNAAGLQDKGIASSVEALLHTELPEDYKSFLVRHGNIVGRISGVTNKALSPSFGNVVSDTNRAKEKFPDLPSGGVVLLNDEECNYIVLLEGKRVNIYYPNRHLGRLGPIRESFESFTNFFVSVLDDVLETLI